MKLLILILYLKCVLLKLFHLNGRSAKEKGLVNVRSQDDGWGWTGDNTKQKTILLCLHFNYICLDWDTFAWL